MEIRKVRGEVNPAELFTKHLSSEERVFSLLKLFGCRLSDGRAKEAPQLRRDVGVRHTGVLACEVTDNARVVIQYGYAYKFETLYDAGGSACPKHTCTMIPCSHTRFAATWPPYSRGLSQQTRWRKSPKPKTLLKRAVLR